MNTNKNSNNNNGEKGLEEENSKIVKQNSEEKKQQNREKNKLRMQEHRANLSDEQKQQVREKERLKRQQERRILSEEQKQQVREKERLKRQQERRILSEEERSIRKEENALQHRNKYQEENSFIQKYFDKNDNDVDDDDDEEYENEVDSRAAADRAKDWIAYREKRYAQSRIYKKARYAQAKDAEIKLKAIIEGVDNETAVEISTSDNDIHQLQQLATRRQQILDYGREYSKTYRQNHHRRSWVPIQQVWDEDNPCRYNIIF
jgi:hypothetical protein